MIFFRQGVILTPCFFYEGVYQAPCLKKGRLCLKTLRVFTEMRTVRDLINDAAFQRQPPVPEH